MLKNVSAFPNDTLLSYSIHKAPSIETGPCCNSQYKRAHMAGPRSPCAGTVTGLCTCTMRVLTRVRRHGLCHIESAVQRVCGGIRDLDLISVAVLTPN